MRKMLFKVRSSRTYNQSAYQQLPFIHLANGVVQAKFAPLPNLRNSLNYTFATCPFLFNLNVATWSMALSFVRLNASLRDFY